MYAIPLKCLSDSIEKNFLCWILKAEGKEKRRSRDNAHDCVAAEAILFRRGQLQVEIYNDTFDLQILIISKNKQTAVPDV